MNPNLKNIFKELNESIIECDEALRQLEQKSKIITQHVETSIYRTETNK